jgi:CheY-like chemotaxis protein
MARDARPLRDTLSDALMSEEKKQLGRILLRQKVISQEALEGALAAQRHAHDGKPLASRLTEGGLISETDALRALSEQFGVPGVDLGQVAILLEHLVIPREIAEAHKILPLLVKDDRIFLAMANPGDKKVIDEIEFVTGKRVFAYVALTGPLLKTTSDAYDAKSQGETYFLAPGVTQETLLRLGLTTRAPGGAPRSMETGSFPAVVDEISARSAEGADISTTDFGNVSEDVSQVAMLPEELKVLPGSQPSGAPSGKLALVVDDEEEIRKLVRRLLAEKGFRVIEADRGLLALRLVKEHVPDVIVLDAMLPELHGFDIARRIKGSQKYGHIPIVMMSAVYRGWRIAEDLKTGYGIEEYLEKPFKLGDLLAAVNRALAARSAGMALPAGAMERDREAISSEAEAALAKGIEAYRAGDLDAAIEHLKRGVGIDPLAYRLRFHLALLYGKKAMVYEAIQELEHAIELNPRHFPALKNLAVLYEKAGFRHKAAEMWERCIPVAPDEDTRAQIKQHLLGLI